MAGNIHVLKSSCCEHSLSQLHHALLAIHCATGYAKYAIRALGLHAACNSSCTFWIVLTLSFVGCLIEHMHACMHVHVHAVFAEQLNIAL